LSTPLLPPGGAEELAKIQGQLEDLTRRFPTSTKSAPVARTVVEANTACPNCKTLVAVAIGTSRGDSAFNRCGNCGELFHAHRQADGTVFTRRPGRGFGTADWGAQEARPVKSDDPPS
jgi:predicted Zn finger-like uncharacterized protein